MKKLPMIKSPEGEILDDWRNHLSVSSDAPQTILIVDDSELQRKILSTQLKKWGYHVLEAASGHDALMLCQTHDISMVLSDWVMPGMNGTELCRAFRQIDRNGYGYFILLTSKSENGAVAEGLNSGADDFLTKPVGAAELRARLRAGGRVVQMQAELVEKNSVVQGALREIKTLYDNLERDLAEARNLQQSLVRDTEIQYQQGKASLLLKPSGHVGGDLVGQFHINETTIGLFSLDVSGHGVTSALMTARLAGYLSGLNPRQNLAILENSDGSFSARAPAEIAAHLNDLLLRELDTEHYFTIVLVIIDLTTGHLEGIQAGHPHPILQRANKPPELIGNGGLPVGLLFGAQFESFETKLNPGDRLMLYSDGITECANRAGTMLTEDGLMNIMSGNNVLEGQGLLQKILIELENFSENADFEDDVSALVFDFTGPTDPS